ncbi:hypothetical protein ABEB36_000401 [Hypothenemus hampei]|uniref:RNase H type-1 domain-containing protein n=1 Tax=Hypothenemus hampei TaxID=57062 RepID=A0ABD1FB36_HYPHA
MEGSVGMVCAERDGMWRKGMRVMGEGGNVQVEMSAIRAALGSITESDAKGAFIVHTDSRVEVPQRCRADVHRARQCEGVPKEVWVSGLGVEDMEHVREICAKENWVNVRERMIERRVVWNDIVLRDERGHPTSLPRDANSRTRLSNRSERVPGWLIGENFGLQERLSDLGTPTLKATATI